MQRQVAVWKHILCPVDFSETSGLGLRYAGALARCSQSRLTVLYADRFEPPPYFTKSQIDQYAEQCRDCKAQAESRLHDTAVQISAARSSRLLHPLKMTSPSAS
jgi:hypothetical protein